MSPSVSVRLLLTQSDARLVAYARAGHERAFEALVRRYRRQLHDYCRRLLLSDERAEDALQQALLQAWVALRDGIEVRDVRPWLYRIVHNAAVNALRVSGYDYCKLSESLSGAGAPQDDLDRRIAIREALAGLAALPDMQREALLRTAVEGRSHQQVASDLGLSEPALRGLVYRARAAMRAAAGAIVPPPLLSWALEAGTRGAPALEGMAGVGAGGSAGLAGLLVKGGAVAVTAGALAGGLMTAHGHSEPARSAAHPRSAHLSAADAATPGPGASVRPAAFTRTAGNDASSPVAQRPSRSPGGGRRGALPIHARAPHSLAPARAWKQHQPGDGGSPQLEGPQPGLDTHDGGGQGGSSHDRFGAPDPSSGSGSSSGDHEQRDGGGTSLDGGGSTSSGKDGSGDAPVGQPSGSGQPNTSSDGGSAGTKDDSANPQPSEPTSGGDSSTSHSPSGTSTIKDSAGFTGEATKSD
ncbi:MAG TPA: sigma-70 family RNA polymerase sigma factor [Solirubrobacteraceae bacterium]|jgi:RNA polymerase sigma factor (sigma-70 family)|nr:sigma-70 family RNA polymerase sigma factor [Solirubrobacteraceae bacterium]